MSKPTVLFVCIHNAGRSQMAAGYLRHLGGDRVEVLSAGSAPADAINPVAVQAMAEEGIDIAGEQPKILTNDAVKTSDVVITMGCGDTCPFYPGKRYEDWVLDDPAGLHDDDLIALFYRADAMRNDQHRAVSGNLLEVLHNQPFRLIIERASGFIKN